MKNKIFITGANSFIGNRLIQVLIKKKFDISAIDIKQKKIQNVNIKKIDLNYKNLHKYIPKDSIIVHLAAISNDIAAKKNITNTLKTNIGGTDNLIKAAKKKNVKKIIFASSEWIYGTFKSNEKIYENSKIVNTENNSIYSMSKLAGEKILINSSDLIPDLSILRFGIIYGPRKTNLGAIESFILQITNNDKIKINSKKTSRRYIYIDDIISAILVSFKTKGLKIYNVTGERLIDLGYAIKLISKNLNKKIKIIENNKNKYNIRNVFNNKLKRETKWKPVTKFEMGIKKIIKYNKIIVND